MAVQAELPDGTRLEFPDNTDQSVIDRTVKKELGIERAAPRNPASMTPAERKYPEATRPYEGPYTVGERATTGGGDDSVLDALIKVGQNTPELFERALGGAMVGLGEKGQAAARDPSSVAPATAGLRPSDMLVVESEAARAQGKDVEQFRAERQEAAEKPPLAEKGYEVFRDATERLRENAPDVEPGTAPYYAYMAGEAFVNMGPAVISSIVTRSPNVGLTIMGGQVAADRYAEARERGLEPGEAAGEATYYAATEALTEKIPLGILTRGGGNWAKRAFKSAVAEGFQEPISEALQMGYEMGVLDEDLTPQEAARRLRDAGVIGFLAGGGLSISTEPLVRLRNRGEKIGEAPPEDTETPDVEASREPEEPATKAQRASAGEIPLDEVSPDSRVAEMSPEDMRRALLESDVTGLPNRRAFVEADKRPGRVSADVDSLKWVNDNISHDAGNALLGAVGRAFQEEGVEAYHVSGDEFLAQADSPKIAQEQMERVAQRLQGMRMQAELPDGQVIEITPGISYGAGQSLTEAESRLGREKARREAAGERAARGERPPTVRDVETEDRGTGVQPRGRQDQGAVAERVEAMAVEQMPGQNYQGMLREAAPPETPTIDLSGNRRVQVPEVPIRRRNIIRSIEREFGNRIYTGRVKGKMLGFHRKSNNEIRTKRTDDLEVTAHELAHWIDDRYPSFAKSYKSSRYADELRGISYDVDKVNEGFAEFVRLYLTQEKEARERAPKFFGEFQRLLEKNDLTQKVNRIQEDMHAWYYQGARQRLASKMGHTQSMRQRLDSSLDRATDRFITQALDGLHEIGVAEKDLQGYIADATKSPYKAFRLVAGARGTVKSIFHHGTIGWDRNGDIHFTGKSLESIFSPIADNLENAKLYFIARRAEELKRQGRENLVENDEIAAGLREGERDPRLKTAFDEWLSFNSRMMDFYEDSGIVSKQSRKAMEEANQSYVPFHRIIETIQGEERTRGGGFQRLRGGTANLGDIFENIEQSVATLTRMALINRAKQLAYDMVDKYKGGSYYAVKIPKESRPVQVSENDIIEKVAPGFGLTASQYRQYRKTGQIPEGHTDQSMAAVDMVIDRMAAMDQFTTFFQHGQEPRGDNIDSVMRDGEVEYYEIGDPLWSIAMSHFGPKNVNLALRIAGGFANTLRRGVTSMPSFLVPNLIRDGTNAIMFSRGGWRGRIPFAGALNGWSDAIRKDETYWRFLANGGGFSSTVHGEVEQSVERFYEREGINYRSVLDTPQKLLSSWDSITSAFEYGTRLGEFRQVEQRTGSPREASLSGREISTDFSMHGASQTLAALRMSVPFFNTRVQGLYKIVREAGATKERNGSVTGMAAAMAIRGLSLLTIPSLALWAWNNMDDERREKYQSLPNWVRDMHWVVYVPGRDAPFLIPKPFEIGAMFATVPERMADAAVQGDGEELGPALYWVFAEQLNLAPMPQVFNPVYEDMTNENFLDMPVIPPDLQDVNPVEQFKPWTSETARAIGERLGVSPMRIEHYLRGYFGTLGAEVLAAADIMLHDEAVYGEKPASDITDYPVVRRFVGKDPQTSTKQQKEWYEFMQSVREAQATTRKMLKEGRDPRQYLAENPQDALLSGVAETSQYRNITNTINEIQAAMERVRVSKALSAEGKRDQLDELQRQLNQVYRQASEFAEEVEGAQ